MLFPGGFGTMDEAFEALTLIQTGKAGTMPIVMIDEPGGEYWHKWIEYISNELLNARLISEEDERFFRVTYSVGEASARSTISIASITASVTSARIWCSG